MTHRWTLVSEAAIEPADVVAAATGLIPGGAIVRMEPLAFQLCDAEGHEVVAWWPSRQIATLAALSVSRAADAGEAAVGRWWTEFSVELDGLEAAVPVLQRLAERLT